MSKKEIRHEDLKTGCTYIVKLHSGAIITGCMTAKCESMIDNEKTVKYRFMPDESSFIDLDGRQIDEIGEVNTSKCKEYFLEFADRYDIKCFDNNGELLPDLKILTNILCDDKKIWLKLKKKKKKELLQYLYFNNKDILDLIEAYIILKEDNEESHKYKLKILNAASEFLNNFLEHKNEFSRDRKFNRVFEKLGIEEFINQIC